MHCLPSLYVLCIAFSFLSLPFFNLTILLLVSLANMLFTSFKPLSLGITLLSVLSAKALSHVPGLDPRQVPANATGLKTIKSPSGVTIRYKEPGKDGVCETTPGVNSYSGYVDLAPDAHTFFWFFEARKNPETAPLTLWLNGGPGSDSLIGLFQGEYGWRGFVMTQSTKCNRTWPLQRDRRYEDSC